MVEWSMFVTPVCFLDSLPSYSSKNEKNNLRHTHTAHTSFYQVTSQKKKLVGTTDGSLNCWSMLRRNLVRCYLSTILDTVSSIHQMCYLQSLRSCIGLQCINRCCAFSSLFTVASRFVSFAVVFNLGHGVLVSFEMQLWDCASVIMCCLIPCFAFSDNDRILYWLSNLLLFQLLFHYMVPLCVQ